MCEHLGVQIYGGSLGLLRVQRTARRPLAVKPRGMECRCLARRNILPPLRGHRSKFCVMGQLHISYTSFARRDCSTWSGSGWQGRGTSRLTPRSNMLVDVCTVTVRIIPSASGWTLITRPKVHCIDGTLFSLIMARCFRVFCSCPCSTYYGWSTR